MGSLMGIGAEVFPSSLSEAKELLEPACGLLPIDPARGDIQRECEPRLQIKLLLREQAVLAEKNKARRERGSLVAIHECVVPTQIE